MPRIPIFRLGHQAEEVVPPRLASYIPSLSLQGLQVGVDNLRHDVHLSPKFVDRVRQQIANLLIRHGDLEAPLGATAPEKAKNQFIQSKLSAKSQPEPADLKSLLTELHVAALNSAKTQANPVLDLLARAAIIKFLRLELSSQFAQVLERCRMTLKGYEGFRHQKALEYRERLAAFQVGKKIILRKTGEELFRTIREVEKETLARTRRSLFGSSNEEQYRLFLNTLIFTEDGSDPQVNAEHYVMLGNFETDPDRLRTFGVLPANSCNRCNLISVMMRSARWMDGSTSPRTLKNWWEAGFRTSPIRRAVRKRPVLQTGSVFWNAKG
jgi:hypothetical protein